MKYLMPCFSIIKESILSHKVPIIILLVLRCVPYSLVSWVWLILGYSAAESLLKCVPAAKQRDIKERIAARFGKERWLCDLKDGIVEARPFVMTGAYFFIPIGLTWIACHWLGENVFKSHEGPKLRNENCLVLYQNRSNAEAERRNNFYHSPAFAPTIIAIFVSGIPALISYLVYLGLGIDAVIGHPSKNPEFGFVFCQVLLYVYSLGWCLSVLFMRAWFTFPAGFCSHEHTVEVTEKGIRKNPIEGWFASMLTFNTPGRGLSVIDWTDVGRLGLETNSFYPLPDTVFPRHSTIYRVFNIIAGFMEGIIARVGRTEYITIHPEGSSEQLMQLSLKDLSCEDRKNFLEAVCKWAPHVLIDEALQLKLIGSTRFKDEMVARLWFDKLVAAVGTKEIMTSEAPSVLKSFTFPERILEFETELRLGLLKHPNLVGLLDHSVTGQTGSLHYECVEGKTLRELVRLNGPFGKKEVASLAVQLCDVLDFLHKQSPAVICRQLTPDNIAMRPDGRIVLFDINDSSHVNPSYRVPGSLEDEVCVQNDIFALGAIVHFLCTGEDPRPDDIANQDGEKDVSASIDRIVRNATDINAESRYESLQWLSLELSAL